MSLVLLLLLTAIYFVRPHEFLPEFLGARLYIMAVVPCIVVSLPKWAGQLSPGKLAAYPVSAMLLGLMAVTAVSHLVNGGGLELPAGWRACLYYFLLVGIVDTPRKRTVFLWGLTVILGVLAALMLLNHHGLITFDAGYALTDHTEGQRERWLGRAAALRIERGMFDPNDTAVMLTPGILIALHFLLTPGWLPLRAAAGGMALVMVRALQLTDSRGGLLALMAGLAVYLLLRWGRKGLLYAACLLPLAFAWVATERTAAIGPALEGRETGQHRLQAWGSALVMFRQNPVFGSGPDGFRQYTGRASHNTFVQAYAELGLPGGTLFWGAFVFGFAGVARLARAARHGGAPGAHAPANVSGGPGGAGVPGGRGHNPRDHVGPPPPVTPAACVVGAVVAGYAVGILGLSHLFLTNTYVVLGLATAAVQVEGAESELPGPTLLLRLGAVSAAFLVVTRVLVALLVRY